MPSVELIRQQNEDSSSDESTGESSSDAETYNSSDGDSDTEGEVTSATVTEEAGKGESIGASGTADVSESQKEEAASGSHKDEASQEESELADSEGSSAESVDFDSDSGSSGDEASGEESKDEDTTVTKKEAKDEEPQKDVSQNTVTYSVVTTVAGIAPDDMGGVVTTVAGIPPCDTPAKPVQHVTKQESLSEEKVQAPSAEARKVEECKNYFHYTTVAGITPDPHEGLIMSVAGVSPSASYVDGKVEKRDLAKVDEIKKDDITSEKKEKPATETDIKLEQPESDSIVETQAKNQESEIKAVDAKTEAQPTEPKPEEETELIEKSPEEGKKKKKDKKEKKEKKKSKKGKEERHIVDTSSQIPEVPAAEVIPDTASQASEIKEQSAETVTDRTSEAAGVKEPKIETVSNQKPAALDDDAVKGVTMNVAGIEPPKEETLGLEECIKVEETQETQESAPKEGFAEPVTSSDQHMEFVASKDEGRSDIKEEINVETAEAVKEEIVVQAVENMTEPSADKEEVDKEVGAYSQLKTLLKGEKQPEDLPEAKPPHEDVEEAKIVAQAEAAKQDNAKYEGKVYSTRMLQVRSLISSQERLFSLLDKTRHEFSSLDTEVAILKKQCWAHRYSYCLPKKVTTRSHLY